MIPLPITTGQSPTRIVVFWKPYENQYLVGKTGKQETYKNFDIKGLICLNKCSPVLKAHWHWRKKAITYWKLMILQSVRSSKLQNCSKQIGMTNSTTAWWGGTRKKYHLDLFCTAMYPAEACTMVVHALDATSRRSNRNQRREES